MNINIVASMVSFFRVAVVYFGVGEIIIMHPDVAVGKSRWAVRRRERRPCR